MFYELHDDGTCRLGMKGKTIMVIASIINMVRANSMQRIYFLIDDFKFHIYHKANYTGVIA